MHKKQKREVPYLILSIIDHWSLCLFRSVPTYKRQDYSKNPISSTFSGRSSCMSPMSELSSSSGSSRTSLRSSSIVSSSNILLEEEGEAELEYTDLCRELLIFAPPDSRIVTLISKLEVIFPKILSALIERH